MNFGDEESPRFFAEPALSGTRFFAALRMTRGEGLRMTLVPVIARHDSAEAISWWDNEIAALRSQ